MNPGKLHCLRPALNNGFAQRPRSNAVTAPQTDISFILGNVKFIAEASGLLWFVRV